MRIIRPEDFKRLPKKRSRSKRFFLSSVVVLFVAGGYFAYQGANKKPAGPASLAAQTEDNNHVSAASPKTGALKQFTSEEFKALARSIKYPNTQTFVEPPPITGNLQADARIRSIAEERGYRMTSMPVSAIQKIDEPRLEGDDLLQPLAAIGWHDLKATAAKDRVPLSIISAYRSPEYQRNLFMQRLLARNVTIPQIAAGQGDTAVESTLEMTAVPGYSRHHTGYTVDLWCEDGSGKFLSSWCYAWISANNYQKAKESGWIPSYPDGVQGQGPEPEPWEYVWVGKDNLTD